MTFVYHMCHTIFQVNTFPWKIFFICSLFSFIFQHKHTHTHNIISISNETKVNGNFSHCFTEKGANTERASVILKYSCWISRNRIRMFARNVLMKHLWRKRKVATSKCQLIFFYTFANGIWKYLHHRLSYVHPTIFHIHIHIVSLGSRNVRNVYTHCNETKKKWFYMWKCFNVICFVTPHVKIISSHIRGMRNWSVCRLIGIQMECKHVYNITVFLLWKSVKVFVWMTHIYMQQTGNEMNILFQWFYCLRWMVHWLLPKYTHTHTLCFQWEKNGKKSQRTCTRVYFMEINGWNLIILQPHSQSEILNFNHCLV